MVEEIKGIMERHLRYDDLNDIPEEEIKYLQKVTSKKLGFRDF